MAASNWRGVFPAACTQFNEDESHQHPRDP